jgi:aldehyde dehydrogenase (NAD+)
VGILMKEVLSKLNELEIDFNKTISGTFNGEWLIEDSDKTLEVISPIDASEIAKVSTTNNNSYEKVISAASENFIRFRNTPAPRRGEIIRQIGDEFRRLKSPLAKLITCETGKILPEAEGEVQEMIDITDFSVGLSRQLYGKTMHSERPQHRMYEQWHPLGNIGVITAFNFPGAVWSWNAMVAAVCGNSIVWKPSEITPLTAIAVTKICHKITKEHGFPSLFTLMTGTGSEVGEKMASDNRFPLISSTGSCKMGKSVASTVGKRLGRSLLELGGNNAIIILKDADLDLAIRASLFGSVGTAGQRCTSTRRILIEKDIQEEFTERLITAYKQVRIGNPLLDAGILMGPVIDARAVNAFTSALSRVEKEGGKILTGGKVLENSPSPFYVEPTIVLANKTMPLLQEETFAPILYIIPIKDLNEAIEIHNAVPQGLSSSIFTKDLQKAEQFLSASGSDCGIANVNIGTSGAEIGGAFGGEKETGGGREAGSDSWKAYMRRQTNTINWSNELPLAQGIKFS